MFIASLFILAKIWKQHQCLSGDKWIKKIHAHTHTHTHTHRNSIHPWQSLHAMQETWVWPLGWEDRLEKEMATHSSILAWWIPWTEEPGGLQSTGLQRVRHGWATLLTSNDKQQTSVPEKDVRKLRFEHKGKAESWQWNSNLEEKPLATYPPRLIHDNLEAKLFVK